MRGRKSNAEQQAKLVVFFILIIGVLSVVDGLINWWIQLSVFVKGSLILSLSFVLYSTVTLINIRRQYRKQLEIEERKKRIIRAAEMKKIRQMRPREFEYFVADLFKALGFDAYVTKATGDGGKDIIVHKDEMTAIVECKRYKDKKISVNLIRQFHSVIIDQHSDKGYFVTTSTFTKEATRYAINKPIKLIDGEELVNYIQKIANQ
ncbi:restriction endonuclease [Sporolactobacillus kofuensis]|uniref:Restriction endonuclease n=1 Tax=Sporolactobacillus kofuensis TaxID=269672 RepID=A0ABW1WJ60_9BACL|nr:restriction endonuclease [Sporolactobacillus kofuensis]MCO7177193.1 restriction endonuclease [Sporolactobacillus kofuensis]